MTTYIKRVPQFSAQQFMGVESIEKILCLTGQEGFRYESSSAGKGPVLYLKTNDIAARVVEDSDIVINWRQFLVRNESGELAVMDAEKFRDEYEVVK